MASPSTPAPTDRAVDRRRAAVPKITYPEELPVSQRRDEIAAAIRDHQVVIVAGETGSGKTTQLPKICLELGRGVEGMIGHTQPRRIAARSVAARIADELSTPLGAAVGFQIRFNATVGEQTLLKVMTDGILLAEIAADRMLRRYDTLIIDEAHERSLNIDFILGYLHQLLPRRPDLKLIITSATIDPQRFSRHFGDAPVIEVSGRTYPVELRYRPIVDPDDPDADPDRDQVQAIVDAVEELRHERPGDILVFLSGEREIRDAADALGRAHLPDTEIIPLYARLSTADQQRVFAPHRGRRIVLATNVAETSLTVPGIRYVIDPGTARISRYSHRLKVQRLPIEPVSQASANQRAGRCGRTSDGICVRLYSQADYEARPAFTEPEILRTNLASVILQMTALGLGEVAAFGFIDPPDRRNVSAGIDLLTEIGALGLDAGRPLTPVGRRLAQLPVDPRLGRMVLEAERNGCVRDVVVIAAALSIQDPRERPSDQQASADARHARFAHPDSDFLTYLNLWRYLAEQQTARSGNQFRKLCRAEFLNYLRVREWQDLESQLRQTLRSLGIALGTPRTQPSIVESSSDEAVRDPISAAEAQRIHTCVLAGLLSHVGLKDAERSEYAGARGAKFAIFPGSALARRPPRWVVAAELVETSRLWARIAARIEPEWVEPLAGHLVKRAYSEPHWSAKRGGVVAYERVTLYGVPLVARRMVNYGRIDPVLSRELFIRHALVEGDWDSPHTFLADNRALLAEVAELEHRARRRDVVVDDQTLYDFYDARVAESVVSARHFDSWWRKAQRDDRELLSFSRDMLVNPDARVVTRTDFPDVWRQGELNLALEYRFEPGTPNDGVTVHTPLIAINQLDPEDFAWQVPGLREELVVALIRGLPKQLRRSFVPVPDHARQVLARVTPRSKPLLAAITDELAAMTGERVPADAWRPGDVPAHLRMTFEVRDGSGAVLASGKDLEALRAALRPKTQAALSTAGRQLERDGLREWSFGVLPRTFEQTSGGYAVRAYPAIVDCGDSVAVRLLESEAEQASAMWAGTRRLLLLGAPSPVRFLLAQLSTAEKLTLNHNPHGSVAAMLADCTACAVDEILRERGGPVWTPEEFGRLAAAVRAELNPMVLQVVSRVRDVLGLAYQVVSRLGRTPASPATAAIAPALADLRAQYLGLIYDGFVTATGLRQLTQLPRYLTAMLQRLDKLPENPARDRQWQQQVEVVAAEYRQLLAELAPQRRDEPAVREIRWMIEELRVSFFAQTLGTAYPVSDKRIYRAMDQIG
jgi:ATP-dependent helicase HrpA